MFDRLMLYVPKGSKKAYLAKSPWNKFKNIEEYEDADGIEDVGVGKGSATIISRSNMNGQRITTPQKGVNILHYSDGTVKKVLVKKNLGMNL